MKRLLLSCALLLAASASARAESSWIFAPSYYSHDPAKHVRIGQYSTGGPYYTSPQGEYVNTGFRHLHSNIRVNGRSHDHVNVFESWIQVGQQF